MRAALARSAGSGRHPPRQRPTWASRQRRHKWIRMKRVSTIAGQRERAGWRSKGQDISSPLGRGPKKSRSLPEPWRSMDMAAIACAQPSAASCSRPAGHMCAGASRNSPRPVPRRSPARRSGGFLNSTGRPAEQRRATRQDKSRPIFVDLEPGLAKSSS